MSQHHKIDYVEIPSRDIARSKQFFGSVFGFTFSDYGRDYSTFTGSGVKGGFYTSDAVAVTERGSALLVLYSDDLERSQAAVTAAGGKVSKPIFAFPGGRRFHFREPGGSEFGVWGE